MRVRVKLVFDRKTRTNGYVGGGFLGYVEFNGEDRENSDCKCFKVPEAFSYDISSRKVRRCQV